MRPRGLGLHPVEMDENAGEARALPGLLEKTARVAGALLGLMEIKAGESGERRSEEVFAPGQLGAKRKMTEKNECFQWNKAKAHHSYSLC